uniref:Kinesin-associated protein 3 n=1 Tax=Plectus sambesii TaxID=2011161 RepID=A0A914XR60_9BILA
MLHDEARFLKKHIKSVGLDVHTTEKALVIKYQLEATILGELGDPMIGERKECQKIIRLKDLNESTDISALAREVVDRCKLIPPSRLPEVEQLLYYLQNRREPKGSAGSDRVNRRPINSLGPSADFGELGAVADERASLSKLDEYIEMLYEDVPEKIKGTALVLQLARNPDNLEELLQNETLLGALARVLKEDWKKNFDLATNIAYTFFCFSTFTQFQPMISHFKIGALCMQVIEYELKRYDLWKSDLSNKAQSDAKELEKNKRKFILLAAKQEQLLRVCFYLLLNLSEDVKTELKMVNRGLVEMLSRSLERKSNAEFIILVLTFLKKLSVFVENKNQMAKHGVIEKIGQLFPSTNDELVQVAIKLLFNLSFDASMRSRMIAAGLLDHIAPLLDVAVMRVSALKLLYHLSMDDDAKVMITYTDCIALAMSILLGADVAGILEVKAFLVNVALEKRNAQLLAGDQGQGLRLLFERAFSQRDPVILKIIRNIAMHDGPTKAHFIEYIANLAETARRECDQSGKEFDFGLECLAILSQLNVADMDWARLLQETQLIGWIKSKMKPGVAEDDLLLEIVVMCGTVATDKSGAQMLLSNGVVDSLIGLLSAKQEDDEIVLQIVYVFYQMMFHDGLRQKLLADTQVPAYLIDLMHDKNSQIRNMCDNTLQVIADHGDEWARKIQEEKFRWHNAQWLEMVGQQGSLDSANRRIALDVSDDENGDLFNDMYGLQAEDILDNYDSDRPESRLDYRPSNGLSDDD